MITIRPFTNSDTPTILNIWWRCKTAFLKQLPPLSQDILEKRVLSQHYFDAKGLLIAWDDTQDWDGDPFWGGHKNAFWPPGRPLGFVQGLYLPNRRKAALEPMIGLICRLMAAPDTDNPLATRIALLEACERYMKERGVKTIYGGALLGGLPTFARSTLPIGFPVSSPAYQTLTEAGYEVYSRATWFHLSLEDYRPQVNLDVLRWKGNARLEHVFNPLPKTYWDAVTKGNYEWLETRVFVASQPHPVGHISVRIPDLPRSKNERLAVLFDAPSRAELITFDMRPEFAVKGLLQYALSEVFVELRTQKHIQLLETMLTDDLVTSTPAFRALGLKEGESGASFIRHFS